MGLVTGLWKVGGTIKDRKISFAVGSWSLCQSYCLAISTYINNFMSMPGGQARICFAILINKVKMVAECLRDFGEKLQEF